MIHNGITLMLHAPVWYLMHDSHWYLPYHDSTCYMIVIIANYYQFWSGLKLIIPVSPVHYSWMASMYLHITSLALTAINKSTRLAFLLSVYLCLRLVQDSGCRQGCSMLIIRNNADSSIYLLQAMIISETTFYQTGGPNKEQILACNYTMGSPRMMCVITTDWIT